MVAAIAKTFGGVDLRHLFSKWIRRRKEAFLRVISLMVAALVPVKALMRGDIDVQELTVAALLIAFLVPIAIGALIAVDTSSWEADHPNLVTIWNNLPVIIIVVVLVGILAYIKLKRP